MRIPLSLHPWIMAIRLRTLPAAAAPVVVGSALAYYDGGFRLGPALAALAGALLLQIGANLANDFMDAQKGADPATRLGPVRVTSAGLLSAAAVRAGMVFVFILAGLCGLYLASTAGWPILVIGALSILAAMAYTGGPYPLGYHGLGEVFVMLFFGLVAVGGSYYAQTLRYSLLVFAASIPVGCLVMAILVVNNLRDIQTDAAAGKRTTAVRFGESWARSEYRLMLAAAYVVPLIMTVSRLLPGWVMLCLLSLPLALNLYRHIGADTGRLLNLSLAATGRLTMAFSLLFAAGLLLSRYF